MPPLRDDYPQKIGNYEFVGVLGSGGMGTVLKYRSANLDKFVAIKMLRGSRFSEIEYKRFLVEGRAAARLRHRNLLPVHDLGLTEQGDPYLVMDYFAGETMSTLLKQPLRLKQSKLVNIFAQCAEGMSFAHKNGVLHRDLKPSNIMVAAFESENPEVVIFDFGISKLMDEAGASLTKVGEVFGSPSYMSPEQWEGKRLDERSDIYSLGCTFYEILTGAPPFINDSIFVVMDMHKNQVPLSLEEASLGGRFLPQLSDTILKMMAKEPDDRPQTMDAVRDLLLDAAIKTPVATEQSNFPNSLKGSKDSDSPSSPSSPSSPLSTFIPFILIACFFLAIAGGAAIFVTKKETKGELGSGARSGEIGGAENKAASAINEGVEGATSTADSHELNGQAAPLVSSAKLKTAPDPEDRSFAIMKLQEMIAKKSANIDLSNFALIDKDLLDLGADEKLNQINLSGTKITNHTFGTLAKIDGLIAIYADQTEISNEAIKDIIKLPKLRGLHVSQTKLDADCAQYLGQMSGLTDLTLRGVPIGDKGIQEICKLKNLRLLQLNDAEISDAGIAYLVANCKNLQELHCRRNKKITDASLNYLDKLPHLRSITLDGCSCTASGLERFFKRNQAVKSIGTAQESLILDFTDESRSLDGFR